MPLHRFELKCWYMFALSATFRRSFQILPNFAENRLKSHIFRRKFRGISSEFQEFDTICSKAIKISWNCLISLNFEGAKGRQAAKWNWPPFPSDSAEPYQLRMHVFRLPGTWRASCRSSRYFGLSSKGTGAQRRLFCTRRWVCDSHYHFSRRFR